MTTQAPSNTRSSRRPQIEDYRDQVGQYMDAAFKDALITWQYEEIERLQRIVEQPRIEPPVDWKARAEQAEGILSHNMALANATTRRAMNERNAIICKLREKHSAIEIADMVGLTRQRVHQILNEAPLPVEEVHGASAPPPDTALRDCRFQLIVAQEAIRVALGWLTEEDGSEDIAIGILKAANKRSTATKEGEQS